MNLIRDPGNQVNQVQHGSDSKAQEADPREWLTDVLKRITAYNNDYSLDLADLLPHTRLPDDLTNHRIPPRAGGAVV